MKKRPRRALRAPIHDTPVVGPRRRPTKVRPVSPRQRTGAAYETGVLPSRPKDPWIDEGEPEVNG
jgi:hypothetical protein